MPSTCQRKFADLCDLFDYLRDVLDAAEDRGEWIVSRDVRRLLRRTGDAIDRIAAALHGD